MISTSARSEASWKNGTDELTSIVTRPLPNPGRKLSMNSAVSLVDSFSYVILYFAQQQFQTFMKVRMAKGRFESCCTVISTLPNIHNNTRLEDEAS